MSLYFVVFFIVVLYLNNVYSVDLEVKDTAYMRISVIPFYVIADYLNLTSSTFVIAIVKTALLNALNDNTMSMNSQHIVECYEVQR